MRQKLIEILNLKPAAGQAEVSDEQIIAAAAAHRNLADAAATVAGAAEIKAAAAEQDDEDDNQEEWVHDPDFSNFPPGLPWGVYPPRWEVRR